MNTAYKLFQALYAEIPSTNSEKFKRLDYYWAIETAADLVDDIGKGKSLQDVAEHLKKAFDHNRMSAQGMVDYDGMDGWVRALTLLELAKAGEL